MVKAHAHKVVENLISNGSDHLKGLPRANRVDNHVAMYTNEMLRVEHAVLILRYRQCPVLDGLEVSDLSRGVYDLRCKLLSFVEDFMTERILDCWVVAFDKMTFTVLYSQR